MPRPSKSVISTSDVPVGFDTGHPAAPPEFNEGGFGVEDIQIVKPTQLMDKVQEARFMEEKVTIQIEDDSDPNAPQWVHSGHQGITQYVLRGQPQTVKRKFLYSLLAAKTVTMACRFGKDAKGDEFNDLKARAKTTHRVVLIEDRNPLGGMKWFQAVMASAA
jgi:hypothetical protein